LTVSAKTRVPALTAAVITGALRGFIRHNCFYLAAAVAFYSILSLIPFFFVIVSIAGRVVGSFQGVHEAINKILADTIPFYSDLLMDEVIKISLGSGLYGLVGLLFIIWVGSLVFDSLEFSLNQVFESPRKRPYLKAKLMGLAIFPAGGFLLTLILFTSALLGTIQQLPLGYFSDLFSGAQIFLVDLLRASLPHLVLFAVLVLTFRIVPAVKVSYGQACLGGLVSSIGWMVLRFIFGLVILPNPNYGIVYGSLKAMIILILWLFFSVCLVLLSAEVIAAYRRLRPRESNGV
jgi:membrane protein